MGSAMDVRVQHLMVNTSIHLLQQLMVSSCACLPEHLMVNSLAVDVDAMDKYVLCELVFSPGMEAFWPHNPHLQSVFGLSTVK